MTPTQEMAEAYTLLVKYTNAEVRKQSSDFGVYPLELDDKIMDLLEEATNIMITRRLVPVQQFMYEGTIKLTGFTFL